MTEVFIHRCAECGESWVKTHECQPPKPEQPLIGEIWRREAEEAAEKQRQRFAALEAEIATLREIARTTQGDQRAENERLRAALAKLVICSQPFTGDSGCDAVGHAVADRHDARDTCPVVLRLRAAIAEARRDG